MPVASRIDEILAATQQDLFWLPPHVERLDRHDVLAVSDGGESDLFNQVVRTSCPGRDIDALVEETQPFHSGRSQWLVVPTMPMKALESSLPRFGYERRFEGDAFALRTTAHVPMPRTVNVHAVATLEDLDANIRCCNEGFGRPVKPYDAAEQLASCTGEAARTARFVASDRQGEPIGSGNINIYDELSFGFLWAGAVVPKARGRGPTERCCPLA